MLSYPPTLPAVGAQGDIYPSFTFAAPGLPTLNLNDGVTFLAGLRVTGLGPTGIIKVLFEDTPLYDAGTVVGAFLGQRLINLPLTIVSQSGFDQLWVIRQALWAALNPKPGLGTLFVQRSAERPILKIGAILENVPADGWDGPVSAEATVTFRCPDPAWRELQPAIVAWQAGGSGPLVGEGVTFGLAIPMAAPLVFQGAPSNVSLPPYVAGPAALLNPGELLSYPQIGIPGPCTGPTLRNLTTGQTLSFPNLVVPPGQTLVVDMEARTALVGSISVMGQRSGTSQVWGLTPYSVPNVLSFSFTSGAPLLTIKYDIKHLGV